MMRGGVVRRFAPTGSPVHTLDLSATANPSLQFALHGKRDGTDFENVQTIAGLCCGTQQIYALDTYDDSLGLIEMGHTDVAIKCTIFLNTSLVGDSAREVEIFLRGSIASGNCPGIEMNYDYTGGHNIIKQSGTLGNYTPIGSSVTAGPSMQTSRVFKATVVGSAYKMYLDNVLTHQATDTDYLTSTKHGVAFFTRPGAEDDDFGFTLIQWRVIDGVVFTATDAETW
jgi:hypothetical protein